MQAKNMIHRTKQVTFELKPEISISKYPVQIPMWLPSNAI